MKRNGVMNSLIPDEEMAARALNALGSLLSFNIISVIYALLFSDYKNLPFILAVSFGIVAVFALFFAHVNLMYWQLSKNTWFCDVTITVCSGMSVSVWCGIADLIQEQDDLYREALEMKSLTGPWHMKSARNTIQSAGVVVLLMFFHYWRNAAKIALRAKDPIWREPHPVDKSAVYTIIVIASIKAVIFTYYFFQPDFMPIMKLRIGLIAIGILFLVLSDVLDNLRAALAYFSLNRLLLYASVAAVTLFAFIQIVLQFIARAYFKEDILSRSGLRIVAVLNIVCMLLGFYFEAAKEQEAKMHSSHGPETEDLSLLEEVQQE